MVVVWPEQETCWRLLSRPVPKMLTNLWIIFCLLRLTDLLRMTISHRSWSRKSYCFFMRHPPIGLKREAATVESVAAAALASAPHVDLAIAEQDLASSDARIVDYRSMVGESCPH